MFSSSGSAPAQQVPAWKRLGLKLKQPAADPASTPASGRPTGAVGQPSSNRSQGSPGKRKLDAPPPANSSPVPVAKRPRRDETQAAPGPNIQLRRQKSVTFADTPTKHEHKPIGGETKRFSKPGQPKKPKGPAKKQTPPTTDLKPALEYLRLWKSDRDAWKFNKKHQSSLIKHVFDADGIPATDINTFYEYIQDLKGFIRMRLRETALEIKTKDDSEGKSGFPEGTKDLEATQQRYETILSRFISTQASKKRKSFTESEYLADSEDGELVIRRLVKRLRADLILEALSESDESGQTETTTSSSSSATITAGDNNATTTSDADKMKLNDGSGKRRRKLRTANVDSDTSSSESESDSDSDTSSSGSSSDESSDDEEDAPEGNGYNDDTSSSSSSSSSESGSDDESDDD